MAREETEVGSLLSPSGEPTQAGTAPELIFCAAIGADNEVDLSVVL